MDGSSDASGIMNCLSSLLYLRFVHTIMPLLYKHQDALNGLDVLSSEKRRTV